MCRYRIEVSMRTSCACVRHEYMCRRSPLPSMTSGTRRCHRIVSRMTHARRAVAERCGDSDVADFRPAALRGNRAGRFRWVASHCVARSLRRLWDGASHTARAGRGRPDARPLQLPPVHRRPDRGRVDGHHALARASVRLELDAGTARHHRGTPSASVSVNCSSCSSGDTGHADAWMDLVDHRGADVDQHRHHLHRRYADGSPQ